MHTQVLDSTTRQVRSCKMKNTYELKTNIFGQDYLEMTTPDGVMSLVPIDPANSDYQAYLRWLENPDAEITPPTL